RAELQNRNFARGGARRRHSGGGGKGPADFRICPQTNQTSDRWNWRRAEKSGRVHDAGVARLNRNTRRRFGRCARDCPHSLAGTGNSTIGNPGSDANMSVDVAEQLGGASSASPVRAGLAVPASQELRPPLGVRWLGRMNFADALQLQAKVVAQKRNDPNVADTILLHEHHPVYTIAPA